MCVCGEEIKIYPLHKFQVYSAVLCCAVLSCSAASDSCDPTDCSLPGSSVHGILQASTGVGCCFLLQSNSLEPHRLWPSRLLCSWNFLVKNTGLGCHSLLQVYNTVLLNTITMLYTISLELIHLT